MAARSLRSRLVPFAAVLAVAVTTTGPASGLDALAVLDVPSGMEFDASTGQLRSDLLEEDADLAAKQGFDYAVMLGRSRAQPRIDEALTSVSELFSDSFGGILWGDGTSLIVQIKGKVPNAARVILDATGLPYEIQSVARSEKDIDMLIDEVGNQLEALKVFEPPDVSIAVDQVTQAVMVTLNTTESKAGRTSVGLAEFLASRTGAQVVVDFVDRPVFTQMSALGGAELWNSIDFICTTGFTVFTGAGLTGLTTADHCVGDLTPAERYYQEPFTSPIVYHDITYKGGHSGSYGDIAWYTTTGTEYDDFYHATGGLRRDVTGLKTVFGTGDPIVWYGRNVADRSDHSDTIGWLNVSAGGLGRLTCATGAGGLYHKGSSGGPVFSGSVAVGIITGTALISGADRPCFTRMMYTDDIFGSLYLKTT